MASHDLAQARRNMVDGQVRTFDVTDRALIAAMDEVPRELFVPADAEAQAYGDGLVAVEPPGVPGRRLLLAPAILARMIQALEIAPGAKVLDVAGGLGYGAALLARLGAEVVMLESEAGLLDGLTERLRAAGATGRVASRSGPLEAGAPDIAPFDAILVNGAVERAPATLIAQLTPHGRLACIRGGGRLGQATLYVRSGDASGGRGLFDAAAPLLDGFAERPAFVF